MLSLTPLLVNETMMKKKLRNLFVNRGPHAHTHTQRETQTHRHTHTHTQTQTRAQACKLFFFFFFRVWGSGSLCPEAIPPRAECPVFGVVPTRVLQTLCLSLSLSLSLGRHRPPFGSRAVLPDQSGLVCQRGAMASSGLRQNNTRLDFPPPVVRRCFRNNKTGSCCRKQFQEPPPNVRN